LQVQPRDNRDRKLPAYPLLCYCSSRSFFAFISFHCAQPTTIKMMDASLFLDSVVINFALTIEKQEQQQPILLESTTPKHGH
jgi:hypothetical protein